MASGPSYPSKRDWWIAAIIWGGVATMLAPTLVIERVAPPGHSLLVLQLAPLVVAGFMVWVLYGTFYEFAGELLVIRCGPFRFRVPLSELDSVEPTSNPLSSPACSLDRLLLRYGNRRIMISPADKYAFLANLQLRCPRVKRINC
jgi:hypothetical protein